MKPLVRCYSLCVVLACSFLFAAGARAQTGRISGTVLDFEGKPWGGVTVTISSSETGQKFVTKTNGKGKYSQLGVRPGVYEFNFKYPGKVDYTMRAAVNGDQDNDISVNMQEVAAKQGSDYAAAKAKEEAQKQKFAQLKAHFTAGVAAMQQVTTLREQMQGKTGADRSALEDQIKTQCQTAATEFEQAEQGVAEKDVKNHATILGNMGVAYECLKRYGDAATSFGKSVALVPNAGFYVAHATNMTKAGLQNVDPKNTEAQLEELLTAASAECAKAAALDPTTAVTCYRNVGIAFHNGAREKQASEALQKATVADPKNADSWYWLGTSLLGQMETKQVGEKVLGIPKPGTVEAFNKYLELAPNGPYAEEAKQTLAGIATLTGGEATTIKTKKKKK
jgi:tetratricopeptide (TPR) repeat protein